MTSYPSALKIAVIFSCTHNVKAELAYFNYPRGPPKNIGQGYRSAPGIGSPGHPPRARQLMSFMMSHFVSVFSVL